MGLIFGVMCLSLQVSANTEDDINAIYDDAEKEVQDMFEKFWGGICISDDQCLEAVAFCDKSAGKSASVSGNLAVDGQCRPNIWIWIALAAVVLMIRVTLQLILTDNPVNFHMVSDGV